MNSLFLRKAGILSLVLVVSLSGCKWPWEKSEDDSGSGGTTVVDPVPEPVPTCGAISGKVRIIHENDDGWENLGGSIHVWAGGLGFYFRDFWSGEHQWTYITGQEYIAEGTYKIGSESVYSNDLAPGTYVISFTPDIPDTYYLVDKDTLQEKEITNVRVSAGEVTYVGTVTLRYGRK